jgi:hypothetical protein
MIRSQQEKKGETLSKGEKNVNNSDDVAEKKIV